MDKRNSSARLPRISELVVLAQTDTTVGFLSQSTKRLNEVKSRPNNKQFLKVFFCLKDAKKHPVRIPNQHKRKVRRAKHTTFIVKNQALRIAHYPTASTIFKALSWHYSSSANTSGKNFDRAFCAQKADIIVEDKNGLYETQPSNLVRLGTQRLKRLR